jgi:hypothetical protein
MRAFILSIVFYFLSIVAVVATPIDSLKNLLKSAQRSPEKIELQLNLSKELMKQDLNLALDYAQQALFLAKKEGDAKLQINASKQIGTIFYFSGIIDKAIEWIIASRDLAVQFDDKAEILNANINLGTMNIGLGDHKKARGAFLKGDSLIFSTYESLGKPVPVDDLVTLYTNTALCYVKLNEVEGGYVYLKKAEKLLDSVEVYGLPYATMLQVWGVGLVTEKKAEEAIEKFKKAQNILQQVGASVQLIPLHSYLGGAYDLKEDLTNAIKEYDQGFAKSDALKIAFFKEQFAESLYKSYEKSGNRDSSYKYLQIFTKLRDEAKILKANEQLTRVELMKDFEEREKKLNQSYASTTRNYFSIILVVVLLAISLMISIFYYRQKYRVASLAELKMRLDAEKNSLEQEKLRATLTDRESEIVELEKRISKNAMLEHLVDDLQTVQKEGIKKGDAAIPVSDAKSLMQKGKIWEEFEIRFSKTHAGFFEKLMLAYPDLTLNERRLCAFLRLDMTTKEISSITGQSIRAIEIARIRLRKKLNLTQSDTSLFEYFSKL